MVEFYSGTTAVNAFDDQSTQYCHGQRKTISRPAYIFLGLIDILFSALVVGPAVVTYWRSTWNLIGLYIYPDDTQTSCLVSVLIGTCGLFVFNLTQHMLSEYLHPERQKFSYYFGSRLYTYVFGFCCVNAWRGYWLALETFTPSGTEVVFWTTGVSLLVLAFMRSVRNIAAPPFAVNVDSTPGYFHVPTLFRVNVGDFGIHDQLDITNVLIDNDTARQRYRENFKFLIFLTRIQSMIWRIDLKLRIYV